jgi:ribonuclease BN (tRNA processing enzyme)
MHIKVLGCSGAIARECRTTSFLVNGRILIDAGTGVGDLVLEEMSLIDHVFLTHSHLDHIAALPLMIDSCASLRKSPLRVHALPETIQALRDHIFNNVIWPDFSRIPSVDHPFVIFETISPGQSLSFEALTVEALPAVHTVPAQGFAIRGAGGDWVFTGDTAANPQLWKRINELHVKALVIETAFSDRESKLAQLSGHLSPQTLAAELDHIDARWNFPIYITHTKPNETALIMMQVQRFDQTDSRGSNVHHDIRQLKAGQEFSI